MILAVPLAFDPDAGEVFAPVKLRVLKVLLGAGLLGAALARNPGRGSPLRAGRAVDVALACFIVLNLLAYATSMDRSVSLDGEFPEYQGLTTVLAYVAVHLLARTATSGERSLVAVLAAVAATTGLVGAYALVQRAGWDPLWGSADRPFATVGQANSMAAVLVVGLPAAAGLAARRHAPVLRAAAAVAAALGLGGVLVSLSRGAWLGLVAAGVTGVVLLDGRRRRVTGVAVGVAALVAGVLLAGPGRPVADQVVVRARAVATTDTGSTGDHLSLLRVGVAVARDHPWLGTGQEVFPHVAQRYADAELSRAAADRLRPYTLESPHNGLIALAAGAGVPALLAYLAFLAAVLVRLVAACRAGRALALPVVAAVVGHLVASSFMTAEVSSSALVWALLGTAVAAFRPGPHDHGHFARPGPTKCP